MTCRNEVLEAATALVRQGIDPFTPRDIINEMQRRGTSYLDGTIRTHVTSLMCANAPKNHAMTYDDFVRVGWGLYTFNDR